MEPGRHRGDAVALAIPLSEAMERFASFHRGERGHSERTVESYGADLRRLFAGPDGEIDASAFSTTQVRRRLAADQGDCYDVHTIYAAIVVLREIGVLKIRHDDDGPAYYFPILAGKMDLHASPTYELYCKE